MHHLVYPILRHDIGSDMPNSQPDSNLGLNLEVVGPLLLQLRDNLQTLLLGLEDVLFELDVEQRSEAAEKVKVLLERAMSPSRGTDSNLS